MSKNIIIDSAMTDEAILAQNPANPAPPEVLRTIAVLSVTYRGFDDRLHSGQIAIQQAVTSDIKAFFDLALQFNFPIAKVIPISHEKYCWNDELSCNDNNSSGYNYRLVAGTARMSKHATGLAFDINPVQNIYIRYDQTRKEIFRAPSKGVYNKNAPGTLNAINPLVTEMKKRGWIWGGDWTSVSGRIDYQHFER